MAAASWDERRLCDDGACTGLIGNDGLCRVCGRASKFWGDERRRGMQDEPNEPDDEDAADEHDARADRGAGDDDGDERRLCIDGSCTGLQDADGRCRVCGKVDPDAIGRARAAHADDDDDDGDPDDDAADADGEDREGGEDVDRQLCPDGACTGLLGADGACKVCGRRAEA